MQPRQIVISFLLTLMLGVSFTAAEKKSSPIAKSLEEYLRDARANQPPLQTADGSLYGDGGLNSYLASDLKARRINDIVTIRVLENTTASSVADTEGNRKSSVDLGIPSFFGIENNSAKIPFANLVNSKSESTFKGDGSTTRQGKLSAFLSARVKEVLPNGDLVIEGIKELKVNNERQLLTLYGVVRTRDIAPNNVVLSAAIANMQVQIDGKGIVSDHMRPGFLYKLLNKIWPF